MGILMMRRKGFTLIELLVVIAIIAILAAILFPIFTAAQASAKMAKCQNNLKQLCSAANLYEADSLGALMPAFADDGSGNPAWGSKMWMFLINPYLKQLRGSSGGAYELSGVYICPNMPKSIALAGNIDGAVVGTELPPNLRRCYGYNFCYLGGYKNANGKGYEVPSLGQCVKSTKTIRFIETWNFGATGWTKGRGTAYSYAPVRDQNAALGGQNQCLPNKCWPTAWHGGRSSVGWVDGHVTSAKLFPPTQVGGTTAAGDPNVGLMAKTLPGVPNSDDPYFRLADPKP